MCVMTCPNHWKFASLLAAALLLAMPATGQPLIFERSEIRIDPVAVAPAATVGEANIPRIPVRYDVEVRSEEALQLEYIHTLNTLADTGGVAITFAAPSIAALPRMQVFAPVDALFVAEDGTIMQIYPDVVLAELTQDVYAKDPIKAFVFLKAGEVAARHILPKDIIAGPMFYPAPPVMQ